MAAVQLTCLKKLVFISLYCTSIFLIIVRSENNDEYETENYDMLKPTVMVAILVRNKAHVLPWFFGHLENLNYPKERMAIWIVSDHNIDTSAEMLEEWSSSVQHLYHSVHLDIDKIATEYHDEKGPLDWSDKRFNNVIKLRQRALEVARKMWADYIFMLDADVILENTETLSLLVDDDRTIVAPMLNASVGETYSNFWGGMSEKGYYERVSGYFDMVDRKTVGSFAVPMVHSAVLINLQHSAAENLAYNPPPKGYTGPVDDIIIFAHSAKAAGVKMYILNEGYFGTVMVPLDEYNTLQEEADQFTYVKLEAMVERPGLIKSDYVAEAPKDPSDKMGFDEIYMINLVRRPERRERMVFSLNELGIDFKTVDAVDGKQLNVTYLKKLNIDMMPGYADPYHKRKLTMGEIGCFLSHYFIWKEVIEKDYSQVVVFEDDVRFEPYFKKKLEKLMGEAEKTVPNWDLIYLGRKRLHVDDELYVEGSKSLVWPSYTYWTLGYVLSHRGATKLMNQDPLVKMIPVDEYLPIMFDKHPETDWKSHFSPRNLVGLSVSPLLVYPTHYTGEMNYISDTEDSSIIDDHGKKEEL